MNSPRAQMRVESIESIGNSLENIRIEDHSSVEGIKQEKIISNPLPKISQMDVPLSKITEEEKKF